MAAEAMENALNPQDVREQYERQLKGLQESLRRGDAGAACAKKIAVPAGRGREVIETIRQGLQADGIAVSISRLCRWFEVTQRVLPPGEGCAEAAGPIRGADQGHGSRRTLHSATGR